MALYNENELDEMPTADVVPRAEVNRLMQENKILSQNADTAYQDGLNEAQDLYKEQIKSEVAREIFAEIEKLKHSKWDWNDVVEWDALAELKKKYTE